jgi:predicted exporter
VSAKRHLPILLWLAGIIAAIVIIAQTRFSADMSAFLPRSPSPAQQILVDQMQSGAASHLLLLAIENAPEPALAALSKEFGRQLRADTTDFSAVNNGDAAANDFAAMRDLFWRYRYVLSPTVTPARFTADGLHAALMNDLTLLSSNMGSLVKETLPGDPTGEILTLLNGLNAQKQPASRDGVWFSPDGKRALLLAQTRLPGFDIANEEAVLAKIEATFAAAQKSVPDAAGSRRASSPCIRRTR